MARSKKGKVYVESRNLDYKNLGIGFCGYDVGKTWNKDLQTSAEKLGPVQYQKLHHLPN